jgi:hypothetical protein
MQAPATFPPPGSRAILLLRVSSEEQARDDKQSLVEQESILNQAVARFQWRVAI